MLIVNEKQLYNKLLFSLITFYARMDLRAQPWDNARPGCMGARRRRNIRLIFVENFVGNIGILALLTLAATLESGGDALVRSGLHAPALTTRIGFMAAGAVVLFVYGVSVNLPPWDFGRLLGVYVALFFVVAQMINLLAFGIKPGLPIYVGGLLIVSGGLVITFWRA